MEFRNYQKEIINKGTEILGEKGLLYLAMEVRTGKTLTALGICERVGASSILFITKKKAISSIQADYDAYAPSYSMEVINYESLHKIPEHKWDIIICDEAHSMGAFAPPNKRAKQVKELISKHGCSLILLSGTPTPESFSQIYHQMYGHPNNPFAQYKNFYRWADDYVIVKQKMIGGNRINDYSNGIEKKILAAVAPYTINYTQKEAGFKSEVEEEILHVKMSHLTYRMSNMLRNDRVITGNEEVILADTGAKLMSKLHQLYSGTAIFESGNAKTIDYSKAEFIAQRFYEQKIAIFYKFKQELEALKEVYPERLFTTDIDEFNNDPDKSIALQIVSGREGISLKQAKYIVYYNIDFSATSYWQSRDRMNTKDRTYNKVYWIFAEDGIEDKIYKAVIDKKNYTLKHFREDLLTLF
jgi:SNF2 family DNA or RNA helicase